MLNKQVECLDTAMAGIENGSSVLIGGQTGAGIPQNLLNKLIEMNIKDLTIVTNHSGIGDDGIAKLIENKQVRKIICSFPRTNTSEVFKNIYEAGEIELEVVPQGTLSERIRAGGAGIGAFYTKTGSNTLIEKDKEIKIINGERHLLEYAIKTDFALIKGTQSDRWGNIVYNKAARNYNPTMAPAGKVTIAEVDEIVDVPLNPENIVTSGIYVQRVVEIAKGGSE